MDGIELATEYKMLFGKELPFNGWITYDYPEYKKMIEKALETGKPISEEALETLFDPDKTIYDIVQ